MSTPVEYRRLSERHTALVAALEAVVSRAERAAGGEGSPFPGVVAADTLRALLNGHTDAEEANHE